MITRVCNLYLHTSYSIIASPSAYSDTASQAGSEGGPPPPPPPATGAGAAAAAGTCGGVFAPMSKEERERAQDEYVRRHYSGLDIHPNLRSFMFWV